jgi:hypothetical protein
MSPFTSSCTAITFSVFYLWWLHFKLETRFAIAPAASKNNGRYKSGQNGMKNNYLVTQGSISSTFYTQLLRQQS